MKRIAAPVRARWSLRSRTPRIVGAMTSVCLLYLWLHWVSSQQPRTEAVSGQTRQDSKFWQPQAYNASSNLAGLLEHDKAANAAVEFARQGLHVPLSVALSQDLNHHLPDANHTVHMAQAQDINILVAVTSTCCTQQAKQRRLAIRQSWAKSIAEKSLPVQLRFVLAQPAADKLPDAHKLLLDEVSQGDFLFVQNTELYNNLPLKTVSIMRYAVSALPRFSHVLKTDDDCYVRVPKLVEMVQELERRDGEGMMYVGRQENPHGFFPIRDPGSKWYISAEEMPDAVVPWKQRYLSGWGYLLSWEAVQLIVSKVDLYEQQPQQAPGWFAGLHWEDVLVGLLLHEYAELQNKPDYFRAAWDSCASGTVVKHMDVEALEVFPMLYAHERAYMSPWSVQTVNCQVGNYAAGDYWSWKHWRDTLQNVLPV